jgi:hypothetical protein
VPGEGRTGAPTRELPMPFRSLHTIEGWLDEFRQLGYPLSASMKVIQQDGEHGSNTGLVGVTLSNAGSTSYIQPDAIGSTRWMVTFEPRDSAITLDPAGVMQLSAELATVSALCAFLEAKSHEFVGEDQA